MSARRKITAAEYDAIMAALGPSAFSVMVRFNLAPTTVGKLAAKACALQSAGVGA